MKNHQEIGIIFTRQTPVISFVIASELVAATELEAGRMTIVEIGCGAGNSVFPLLSANQNPHLTLRAYDYSSHAVKLVQTNPLYISPPTGIMHAAVWDVTSSDTLPLGVEPGSVDIAILVFVMSALHPNEWGRAMANIHKMLKPGGLVVFRDYGRHDLTQLRFKAGRLLDDNFYIRGDKTRVYFFELDELALLFTGSRVYPAQETTTATQVLDEADEHISDSAHTRPSDSTNPDTSTPTVPPPVVIHPNLLSSLPDCPPHPLFTIEQLGVDHRLLLNRKRQLKMYRVWMQGKFKKT